MTNLYPIIKVPDPVLKQEAQMVQNIDDAIRTQVDTMINTMYHGAGIGLAANQVNKLNRIFVMDLPDGSWVHGEEKDGVIEVLSATPPEEEIAPNPLAMINPEIIWESELQSVYEEGCLSIPKQYAEIVRPAQVRVKFTNYHGEVCEEQYDGLHSHCVQHEIDHLDGVLFTDYLSSLKRNMILKRAKKVIKKL